MKRIAAIILIVFALLLGVEGIKKLDDSSESVKFLGITLKAEDEGGKETAFVMIGLGVLCLVGGVMMMSRGKILES